PQWDARYPSANTGPGRGGIGCDPNRPLSGSFEAQCSPGTTRALPALRTAVWTMGGLEATVSARGKETIVGFGAGAGPRGGGGRGGGVGGAGPGQEMFEAMVNGAREGLCLLTPGSVLLRSNQIAGEILGFDPRRAAGVPVHELGVDRDFDWSIVGEVAAGAV